MVTSVTSRAKPSRESGTAADTPRSSSITMTWDRAQPSATRPPGERVLQPRRFRVLKDLAPGRLPDIHDRGQGQVLRPDLQLRQSLRMHDRVHRDRLPPRPRPAPRASGSPAAASRRPTVAAALQQCSHAQYRPGYTRNARDDFFFTGISSGRLRRISSSARTTSASTNPRSGRISRSPGTPCWSWPRSPSASSPPLRHESRVGSLSIEGIICLGGSLIRAA